VVARADAKVAAIEIARALMSPKTSWATMAKILSKVEEDPESVRWLVLSYATSVALKGGANAARAVAIIEDFTDPYFNTKRAGLVASCFNVINPR
jgi:hypothetical protein